MKNKVIIMVSSSTGLALFNHILEFICVKNSLHPNFEVVTIKSNMQTYRKSIRNYYIAYIQPNSEIVSKTKCILIFESNPTNLELTQCNKEKIKQDLESLGADLSIIKIKDNFETLILKDIKQVLKFLKLSDSFVQWKKLEPFYAIKYLFSEAGLEYSYNDTEAIGKLVKEISAAKLVSSICPNISLLCRSLGLSCKKCSI